MIGLDVRVVGHKAMMAALSKKGAEAGPSIERKVTYWGHVLESRIKFRAPVLTGDYRRSWNTQLRGQTAIVGTNKPQGPRLELGFVGSDSLGRVYNQAPQPHVRPSIDEVRRPFLADMAKVVKP